MPELTGMELFKALEAASSPLCARFLFVTGGADVVANGKVVGAIGSGDCFGETSYVHGAKRAASIIATEPATVLRVSSSQMEQATAATQLRFNKVFLRSLIERLQGLGTAAT